MHFISLIILLTSCIKICWSSGHISVNLVRYINPGGKGSNGNCCDGVKWICRGSCDHYFIMCLDYGSGSDSIDNCPLGRYTTDVTRDVNSIVFGPSIGETPNPKLLRFSTWRAGAQGVKVKVDVWDSDSRNNNDYVEFVTASLPRASPGRSQTSPNSYTIQAAARTTLTLQLSVYCDPDWYGPECQVFCRQRPGSHFDCNQETGAMICHPGWTGEECVHEINECNSSPCSTPGGACIDQDNGYTCECDPGFHGDLCEIDEDECISDPCSNGGTCVDQHGAFFCACASGYNGVTCETEEDICTNQPCQNGGTCHNQAEHFLCTCAQGYTGNTCEEDIDECVNGTCANEGTCVDMINDYYCVCPMGYEGLRCERSEDDCDLGPCLNNGTCVDGHMSYSCQCGPGWTGTYCQIQTCPCMNNATCIHQYDGSQRCLCREGWTGNICQSRIQNCPCMNNVTCMFQDDGSQRCLCQEGWTGNICESNINECDDDETHFCEGNYVCVDSVGGYDCLCPIGYHGDNCEISDISSDDSCHSNPCENNGTCQVEEDGYNCTCLVDFVGKNCETKVLAPFFDKCSGVECFNGGKCVDGNINDTQSVCMCPEGYTGSHCEVKADYCQDNPCLNGATCEQDTRNYICICPLGYTGHRCTEEVDHCQLIQCHNNGTCQSFDGGFTCSCQEGWAGRQCDEATQTCSPDTCLNKGKCENIKSGIRCHCKPGYHGNRCENAVERSPITHNARGKVGEVILNGVPNEKEMARLLQILKGIVKEVLATSDDLMTIVTEYFPCPSEEKNTTNTLLVFGVKVNGSVVPVDDLKTISLTLAEKDTVSVLSLDGGDSCHISTQRSRMPSTSTSTSGVRYQWHYIVVGLGLLAIVVIIVLVARRTYIRSRKGKLEIANQEGNIQRSESQENIIDYNRCFSNILYEESGTGTGSEDAMLFSGGYQPKST